MSAVASSHWRRCAQRLLARHPEMYRRVLHWTGRGNFEKKLFLALIQRGDIVFDLGANTGYFTLLFSDLVGPHGAVHAFEPVPPTFAALETRMELAAGNVTLNNAACTDAAGCVNMLVPMRDSEQASLRRHRFGSWQSATEVVTFATNAVALQDYIRDHAIDRLDLIKCDIEGAELPALRGLGDELPRLQPLLFLEVFAGWTADFDYTPPDLVTFLEEAGYDRFFLVTNHLARLTDRTLLGRFQSEHLLAAVSAKHDDRLRALVKALKR